jgi:soluble lytic murein transglycosylase-like protein
MLAALLAAGGNYSVAQAQGPGERSDQTAIAIPRIGRHGATGVGLPQPLSPSEVTQIRRIFALQSAGSETEAARETQRLTSELLLGPILADRYLRGHATATELAAWLARYGDQPEASSIQGLLERLAPELAPPPTEPPPPVQRAGRMVPGQGRALFVHNRDGEALNAASFAHADAETMFVGGLAAVRLGRDENANALFNAVAHSAPTPAIRAGGAFWAGWIAERVGNRRQFSVWMRRAALEGDTFYGLIARRALGPAVACIPGATVGTADLEALMATPQGRRAFALLQVGERRLAEAELRALWADTAPDGIFDRSIVLAANATGFTRLAADIEQRGLPRPSTAAARLRPASGFLIDPPLIYALVRHESNFQTMAVSRTGARGLMQILPSTAHDVSGSEAGQLHDPAVNLAVGQQYLLLLAADNVISGDLVRTLAGYAEGQTGLRKWVDAVHDNGDPLMFIEAIPNPGTRSFIQDSLVYSWHYATELQLPAASLDALASGRYPRLVRASEIARDAPEHACRPRREAAQLP